MLWCTIQALGEMAVLFPVAGSFSAYSTVSRFATLSGHIFADLLPAILRSGLGLRNGIGKNPIFLWHEAMLTA